jgi:L-amino acid N-acyltransferase YncA|tara:strand:+ start:7167 stop:7634 length:468 start_codon:yes stop_codon:yes gene_type:complete
MDIRKANVTDGYEIEELVKLCAETSDMMMIDRVDADGVISKVVLSPNFHVYVAMIGGEIVGVIIGVQGSMFSNIHNMEVSMCVSHKWTRMGVGSMLMEYFLLEHGWRNVYAEVVSDNEPIIRLLTMHNYKLVCSLPKFVNTRRGFRDKMIFTYNG